MNEGNPGRLRGWGGLLLAAVVLGAIVWIWKDELQEGVLAFLGWVDGLGRWGPVLFTFVVAISMLTLFPGMMFTLGAGFLFGPLLGTVYVVAGTTVGAACAFLAGRYIFRGTVYSALSRRPRLQRFVEVVEQEGWRFVMFTRMVPFFPFKLSNYVFGVTRIPVLHFVGSTCIGMVPIAFTNVYAGSLLGSLAVLGTEDAPETPFRWVVYLGGFAIALGFAMYVTYLARKSLASYLGPDAG